MSGKEKTPQLASAGDREAVERLVDRALSQRTEAAAEAEAWRFRQASAALGNLAAGLANDAPREKLVSLLEKTECALAKLDLPDDADWVLRRVLLALSDTFKWTPNRLERRILVALVAGLETALQRIEEMLR
jgi:hypothetical protein